MWPLRPLADLCAAAALGCLLIVASCSEGAQQTPVKAGPDLQRLLADSPAPRLSDYGLFEDVAAHVPARGVIPYDLVNSLFSDHAAKHRFVFVPEGRAAAYSEDRIFAFPVGTVLVKTFSFAPDMREPGDGSYFVETRLLIRKQDAWAAYPYIWTEDGQDAVYSPVGGRRIVETVSPQGLALSLDYHIPNQNQCKTCHQSGRDIEPIGPKARDLNHIGPRGVNQLEDWSAIGMLSGLPGSPPAAPAIQDLDLAIGDRARAWLDINCAHCHKPDGSASNSGLWLDAGVTEPIRIGIGKRPVAAGRGSGGLFEVIVPGRPEESILYYRLAASEPGVRMPDIGRSVEDPEGLALIRDWIASLDP